MKIFGEYIKSLRISKEITLRDFCRRVNIDASNWSKIERGKISPPKSKTVLNNIAETLGIETSSEEYLTLCDLAAISYIPTELLSNKEVVEKLPVFFRTARGEKPTDDELKELINLIKAG